MANFAQSLIADRELLIADRDRWKALVDHLERKLSESQAAEKNCDRLSVPSVFSNPPDLVAKALANGKPDTSANLQLIVDALCAVVDTGRPISKTESVLKSDSLACSLAEAGLKMTATLLRKNRDYGGSAYKNPVLAAGLSPLEAMLCRLSDKVARLSRLLSGEKAAVESESVADTLMDQAGYCILIWNWVTQYIDGTLDLEKTLEQKSKAADDASGEFTHRSYRIRYNPPPIPFRGFDWEWCHIDCSGPEDKRIGRSCSLEAAREAIDDLDERCMGATT